MTTKELIDRLLELDPDGKMEVICTRCSDYQAVHSDEVTVVSAVKKPSANYIMRDHQTMSVEDRAACRDFVHFDGN